MSAISGNPSAPTRCLLVHCCRLPHLLLPLALRNKNSEVALAHQKKIRHQRQAAVHRRRAAVFLLSLFEKGAGDRKGRR